MYFVELIFCDVDILWKKCGIYFFSLNVLTKFFQPSLKKKIRHICLSYRGIYFVKICGVVNFSAH